MPLPESVQIVEVAPRDGLQNDPAAVEAEVKADLIAGLAAAGIRRIEAASFVSPRAVPKMADSERVLELVRGRLEGWEGSLIGLVVNERGVQRALTAGVDEINAVIIASETFSRRNQSMSIAESLDRLGGLVAPARDGGLTVGVTIAAAFGCPFEGEIPPDRVVDIAGHISSAGVDEIALADTIGCAVPTDIERRVAAVRAVVPAEVPLRAHFHNTRNTGLANAVAAIASGVTALDSSLGGIGGCPFAPNATGNIPTEDLLYLLQRMGVRTGVDLGQVMSQAGALADVLGHPVPGLLARAGIFPPAQDGQR